MADLSRIVGQLKKERDRVQQQLSGLNAALAAFAGVYSKSGKHAPRRRKEAPSLERQGPGRNPPGAKSAMGKSQGRERKIVARFRRTSVTDLGRKRAVLMSSFLRPARLARCAA